MRVPILLALAAIWTTFSAAPLQAQSDEDITYQVKSGDTLYRLADAYFVNAAALKSGRRDVPWELRWIFTHGDGCSFVLPE